MATQGIAAVICDLDGVVTQTARIHQLAWKQMFDPFLKEANKDLFTNDDYLTYVDGKPRYEGVASLLKARNINLPYGSAQDSPDERTICGLGNRKNQLFLELVRKKGVDIYPEAVDKIRNWKNQQLKTAVVSASKNCKFILESAGIEQLFDIRIDGNTAHERGLKGKPEPDTFLEAARELNVQPRTCVLIEDALAGVQAGARGGFGYVVGVSRSGNKAALYDHGADFVLEKMSELELLHNPEIEFIISNQIPSALGPEFDRMLENKKPILFLDYDGTLTPIVKKPDDAVISERMRQTLSRCASRFQTAVVSGRDMDDVKGKVGIDHIIYAGSHGFRIAGPNGLFKEHEKSAELLPQLDKMEDAFHHAFDGKMDGVQVDRKRFAIAIHYRNANPQDLPRIRDQIDEIVTRFTGFALGEGKKILK